VEASREQEKEGTAPALQDIRREGAVEDQQTGGAVRLR
jgi:hypothetical protein